MLFDFQKMFLGIKPKNAISTLKNALYPLNLAQVGKGYNPRNIVRQPTLIDDYSCKYEITYLFATKYHNTFTSKAYFSRDRRILKEKNGKVTKYGPWTYWSYASVIFHALPLQEYKQTQAKLKELYPKFSFSFYKDSVEVYMSRSVNNLSDVQRLIRDFAYEYRKECGSLVDSLNYAHDQIHKK